MSYESEIQAVIERAYIKGIHKDPNREDVLSGFDPSFQMYVSANGKVTPVTLDEFIEKKLQQKQDHPEAFDAAITYTFSVIEQVDDTAVIRIDLSRDGSPAYTDFMLLYQLKGTWKIVAKIYHGY